MTTTNPFADPDYPIDYGITGKDVKPANASGIVKHINASTPKARLPERRVKFQEKALRDQEYGIKIVDEFSTGYSLILPDYERYPLPSEYTSLIIRGLNRKLSKKEQATLEDIANDEMGAGEWTEMTFERNDMLLHCRINPGLIFYNYASGGYESSGMNIGSIRTFDIGMAESQKEITLDGLEAISPELVEYLFGRPYEKIPPEIRQVATVKFPSNGALSPVKYLFSVIGSKELVIDGSGINESGFELYAAARGVK